MQGEEGVTKGILCAYALLCLVSFLFKQPASPFRRVREEEIEVDARVADNSFEAKKGAAGDWGEKANNILKFTKGKSFRHEKTKKKRGSYRGGTISTQVNSVKFESD